jgi:hypothetical protein
MADRQGFGAAALGLPTKNCQKAQLHMYRLLSRSLREGEQSKYCRQNVNESNRMNIRQSLMMRLPNQTLDR